MYKAGSVQNDDRTLAASVTRSPASKTSEAVRTGGNERDKLNEVSMIIQSESNELNTLHDSFMREGGRGSSWFVTGP